MNRLHGTGISLGIAMGKIVICRKKRKPVAKERTGDPQEEIGRYQAAREQAKEELSTLHEQELRAGRGEEAEIFAAQQLILDDEEYESAVRDRIMTQNASASYAVEETGKQFTGQFARMADEYMRARAADVQDVSDRLVRILSGVGAENTRNFPTDMDAVKSSAGGRDRDVLIDSASGNGICGAPVILVAEELSPSETALLDKSRVCAIVVKCGSANSHTAILARSRKIPALTGIEGSDDWDGKTAVADALLGDLILDPDENLIAEYREKRASMERKAQSLLDLAGKQNCTADGHPVRLCANIGDADEVTPALAQEADGIGLFRSEFLYLGREEAPSEETQVQAYQAVAKQMAGKKMIIRTVDLGADKQVPYLHLDKEENPALGYRGIRICLDRTDLFRTQLRAIYRAACCGNLAIMFPMIISVEEVRRIKELIKEVKAELTREKIPYGEAELGIMIETPAAVAISRQLADEVDFFSIGTNDLTQYMLACDRQNARVGAFCDPHHPAVLDAIDYAIRSGHAGGTWVGICGELAADTSLTENLLRMGVDELSVSPSHILAVRDAIRKSIFHKGDKA